MYVCTYVCYWIMRLCVSCTSITWLTVTCSMAFCMRSSCKWQHKCFLSFLCAVILCMQHMHQDVTHVCKWTVTVGSVNATALHVHGHMWSSSPVPLNSFTSYTTEALVMFAIFCVWICMVYVYCSFVGTWSAECLLILILIRLFYICYAMLCSMYGVCTVCTHRYARGRVHSKQWCAFCWWLSSVATCLLRMCVFT